MEAAIKKSDVLIEALPYIKSFFGKVIVIKYGGSTLDKDEIRKQVLQDIVFMRYAGMNPVLVHGGGPLITRMMQESGKEAKFVDGQRVTDKKTVSIINQAFQQLNKQLVEEIKEFGANAYSLSGEQSGIVTAKKLSAEVNLGYVGSVDSVDATIIKQLISADIIPVVSPLGRGKDNEIYNINADNVASFIAATLSAEKFVLLTNVAGILKDIENEDSLIHTLTGQEAKKLIEDKIIAGGMIPKVNACIEAVHNGVKKAHIVNCFLPHALLLEIFTTKGIGTEIVPNKE